MSNYKANAVSRNNIREYVFKIKKIVGLENKLYFPVVRFLDNILPVLIPDFQVEYPTIWEMGNLHGETYPSKNLIRIREDVYLGAVEGKGRDRLTIAHEIGHLFLHEDDAIALCRLDPGQKLKPYEDPEWQANAFGGELLAPSYLIKGMSETQVQSECGVSSAAARCQLKAAETMNIAIYRRWLI